MLPYPNHNHLGKSAIPTSDSSWVSIRSPLNVTSYSAHPSVTRAVMLLFYMLGGKN